MVAGIFKIDLRLKDPHMFLCDNQRKFWTSSIFNFETRFLENENRFQKTGV